MKRILAYGDSNTYGTAPKARMGEASAHGRSERWPDRMAAALGEGWEVIVEGLPGRTTVFDDPVEGEWMNGLRVLPAILKSHVPLDLVIICLGTNDQKARFGLGAQDIAKGVARLVTETLAVPEVGKVLAVAPPQIMEANDFALMFRGATERCAGLSAQIERFTTAAGAAFFDAGSVIEVDPLDGIHWNAAAHSALGAALADEARRLLG